MNEFLEKEPLNYLHLRLPEAGGQCGDEIAAPELVSVGELKMLCRYNWQFPHGLFTIFRQPCLSEP